MAKVIQSDADSIECTNPLFAYNPLTNEFLWAHGDSKKWVLYKSSKVILEDCDMVDCCHSELLVMNNIDWGSDNDLFDFIRGRISEDGKLIYIHDLNHRNYSGLIQMRFEKHVEKTIQKVYKYMAKFIN